MPDEAWSPEAGDSPEGDLIEGDLPGYRDFVLIARGGDSRVYRARQDAVDRLVAVKILEHVSAAHFSRELELTVRLGRAHPHIVTVLDTGTTRSGQPCIVMEYYDLGSLHDQLRARGPLPAGAVVAAGTVVADALAFAHGQGVLHRDVKPQNILVLPTSYVLADFGLARAVDAERSGSLERFSYRHAAPQVLDGELPAIADDIYSLGSTLFTLLDGRPPFAGDDAASDTALAYLRRVRTVTPRPLSAGAAPGELIAIIERCLSRRREDRFADAASLREALDSVVTEERTWAPGLPAKPVDQPAIAPSALHHLGGMDAEPTAPRPVTEPEVIPVRTRPRWPRLAALAGIALLIGAVVGLTSTWLNSTRPKTVNSGAPVPVYTATLGGSSAVADPSIEPQITALTDRGTAIELRWTDPSNGRAVFVVVEVSGTVARPLVQAAAGQTSVVLERLDPAKPYCFSVLAVAGSGQAISPMRCTGPRAAQ